MIEIYLVQHNKKYVACITEDEKKALEYIKEFPCDTCEKIHTCVICNKISSWFDKLRNIVI